MGVHKFKVSVNRATKAKIESIANYKSRVTKEKDVTSAPLFISKKKEYKPQLSLTSVNKDEILNEIDKKRKMLTNEMESLYTVRTSLVWLLDKATLLETQRNHTLDIKANSVNKEGTI